MQKSAKMSCGLSLYLICLILYGNLLVKNVKNGIHSQMSGCENVHKGKLLDNFNAGDACSSGILS